jgi:hypothetical protein
MSQTLALSYSADVHADGFIDPKPYLLAVAQARLHCPSASSCQGHIPVEGHQEELTAQDAGCQVPAVHMARSESF